MKEWRLVCVIGERWGSWEGIWERDFLASSREEKAPVGACERGAEREEHGSRATKGSPTDKGDGRSSETWGAGFVCARCDEKEGVVVMVRVARARRSSCARLAHEVDAGIERGHVPTGGHARQDAAEGVAPRGHQLGARAAAGGA